MEHPEGSSEAIGRSVWARDDTDEPQLVRPYTLTAGRTGSRVNLPLEAPVETVLAIVSGKWKVRILYLLSLDDLAFSEIRQSVGDIRQQVLSSVLKDLIANGVARRAEVALHL